MSAEHKYANAAKKVSIIVVTYNAAASLQKCLDSIYALNYPFEIVIMDGASTDGTVNILEKNSDRIFWKSEPDTGIYDAMNKALHHVTGDWLYFLGSDDELLPGFTGLVNELTGGKTIYYANVIHKNTKRAEKLSPYYMAKVGIYHQSIIYPKYAFATRKYDTRYRVFADYAFNLQCFGDKELSFVYKDHIIANYSHTGLSSHATDESFENDKSSLILKNFGLKIWLRYKFRLLKEQLRKK